MLHSPTAGTHIPAGAIRDVSPACLSAWRLLACAVALACLSPVDGTEGDSPRLLPA